MIQHIDGGKVAAFADLEIVKVMRGRNFHRTRTLFGVGIVIGDNRNFAPDNRQHHMLADKCLIAWVVGMHGNAGIAQHGFGPRGGNGDVAAAILKRIVEVPHMAVDFFLHHLKVGNCRQKPWVPVNKALVFVNQPLFVKRDKHLHHGLRQAVIHGKALAAPIT